MLRYEVTVVLEPALADAFECYMRGRHIPEILATGCFLSAHLDQMEPTRFRTCYLAAHQEALDRYLESHAPHFRGDFVRHFPEGARASREVWTTLEAWRR